MKYVCSLIILALLLAGCGSNLGTTDPGSAAAGEVDIPHNALRITLAYWPEKETWLTERFAAFNASGTEINGSPIFVEGVNKSSGAARGVETESPR